MLSEQNYIGPLLDPLFEGGPEGPTPLVMEVDTTQAGSAADTFILPLRNLSTYDITVDWGDGNSDNITTYNDVNLSHTYSTGGVYEVSITSNQDDFGQVYFNNGGDRRKVTDIKQWGSSVKWSGFNGTFYGCTALDISATDAPDWANATDFTSGWRDCDGLTVFPDYDYTLGTNFTRTFQSIGSTITVPNLDLPASTTCFAMFAAAAFSSYGTINIPVCTNTAFMFQSATGTSIGQITTSNTLLTTANNMLEGVGFTTIDAFNTGAISNFTQFMQNASFTSIPVFDFSSGTDFEDAFNGASSLTTMPAIDFSNGTIFTDAFRGMTSLTTWNATDFSSATTLLRAFFGNTAITTYPQLTTSASLTTADNGFASSTSLNNFGGFSDYSGLSSATALRNLFPSINTTDYSTMLVDIDTDNANSSIELGAGSSTYTATNVDSGTTDGTTASKLIDSTQNFLTTVSIGDIIYNTTDTTYAEVTAVDSDTSLSLDSDIMVSGEAYEVQSSAAAKARYNLISAQSWTIVDGGPA